MHTNKLCGPIPTSIGRLKRLNILHLFGNRMTGIIPEELCECVALTDLQVSRNEFEGPIPQGLGRLTQVRTCYLGQNFLQGPIPDSIGNLSSVTDLQVCWVLLAVEARCCSPAHARPPSLPFSSCSLPRTCSQGRSQSPSRSSPN